jgi:hypothetical protein
MKKIIVILFLICLHLQNVAQTKPIKGTWINLSYQDARNKYMNPAHVDYTSPDFWAHKIQEYSEMGISYLIIMAVANEQMSYYPSNFMQPAYSIERESPIESIMKTADKLGMNVFMSCGWAFNQYDNYNKPEVLILYRRIMKEISDKFGKYKSFYGWYFPIEDGLFPTLSDQAIETVNSLTKEAKKLRPNSRVMISPYGLWMAEVNSIQFAKQIRKLKVDIVAYQDEIGCVREPLPMPRMKKNFKLLGKIHEETDIDFWANVESFTWEKETNSIESALIPAAFPRILSQLVGATQAGVKEIASFAIYGIMEKPDSEMPIGQPCGAVKIYKDYMDWLTGKGRWSWLEATFKGETSHEAMGKKVKLKTPVSMKYAKGDLVDNKWGEEDPGNMNWLGFEGGKMEVVVDLGTNKKINNIGARFLHYRNDLILLPSSVSFHISKDGKNYEKVRTVVMEASENDKYDCWIDIAIAEDIDKRARFVKVEAEGNQHSFILCDEVMVNLKKSN